MVELQGARAQVRSGGVFDGLVLGRIAFRRFVLAGLVFLPGCGASSSNDDVRQCRTDADCGEGSCSTASTCVDRAPAEASTADAGTLSPVGEGDGGAREVVGETVAAGAESAPVDDDAETAPSNAVPSAVSSPVTTSDADDTVAVDTSEVVLPEAFDEAVANTCTSSCERGHFVIPVALCEDFQLRTGESAYAEFEFCETPISGVCADRCEQAFETSQDACQQALLPAVACVNREGYYEGVGPAASDCLFPRCTSELLAMAAHCSGSQSLVKSARTKWSGANPGSYRFKLDDNQVEVVDGQASWVPSGTVDAPTIDELFDRITTTNATPGGVTFAQFDPELGFPTLLIAYHVGTVSCLEGSETAITDFATIEP